MDASAGRGALVRRRRLWFGLVPLAVGSLILSACSPSPPPVAQGSTPASTPPPSRSTSPTAATPPTLVTSPSPSPTVEQSPPMSQPPSSLVDVDSVALPQWSGSGCPASGLELQQSFTGRFTQCLQVGGVPGGDYAIVLQQILSPPTDVAPANPAMPGLQLNVSPASGPPGTTVTITGKVAAPLSPKPGSVSLCWDGCPGGLSYRSEALDWLSPTTFRTTMIVPQAPWVTASPPRVAPLASGTYSIGVQCLQAVHACGLGGAEATTSFQLVVPTSAAPWCRTAASCAQMTVSPARALPGENITVTGYAPIVSFGGDGQPFASQLEVIPAPARGPTVQFQSLGKAEATAAYFGYGALTVTASPTFASINSAGWRPEISDGWQPITADPATPSTTAWCTAGAITIDANGHSTTVPTGMAAQAALTASGFPPQPGGSTAGELTCDTLALLGNGVSGAPAVVAGFGVNPPNQEPLYADVALVTRDGGKSWTPLPTPRGVKSDAFGGFRYQGDAVAAVFTPSDLGPQGNYASPIVEATSDSGRSWHATNLACPATGPCISFGSFQPGNCAKNGASDSVIASADAGHSWALTSLDPNFDACWPTQLLTAADGSELLLDSTSTFTLERSSDGGRTWADIDVPPVPGRLMGNSYDGSTIAVPDGSLLAMGDEITHPWMMLRPGATTWCDVRTPGTLNQDFVFYGGPRAIGDQLWWLTSANDGTGTTAHHIALADLTC